DEMDDSTKLRTFTFLVVRNDLGTQEGIKVVAKLEKAPATYTGVSFTSYYFNGEHDTKTTGEFSKDGKELKIVTKHAEIKKSLVVGKNIPEYSGKLTVPANSIFSAMGTTTFAEADPAKYTSGATATYEAFSESVEDLKYSPMEMTILDTKTVGEQKISQVESDFLNDKTETITFADGQNLGSRDDYNDLIIYLVPRRDDAFGEFGQSALIKTLFDRDVPRGLRNPVADSQGRLNAKDIIQSFTSLKVRKQKSTSKVN
ncbi:MAG: hypothetical protein ACXWQE_13125, partial [Bdellovibrionales bacterium]